MNSPPYGQGAGQQFFGPAEQGNSAQCQNQGFGSPFSPNFPVSPGNWNSPPFTQPPPPPPANGQPFNQPPPPCFAPGPPRHPQHGPPPRQGRAVNNVWSDPSLFRPNFGPPPRMCPPGARPQHHGQFGPPGRGRGRGGFGRGRGGRGGGRHQQHNGHNGHNGHNKNDNSFNQGQNAKKVKTDKRDLPENNKFHCETCDRGFKTEEKYQAHVMEHKQCTVDGCRYVAAPKLVELHYHTQHRTGLAKKIWSLESPEDIQKWIEERKRNFPTKENMARKARDRAERRSRGEMIDTKQFGKMRGRGRGRRGQYGRQRHWEDDQPRQSQEQTGRHDSQADTEKGDNSDRLNHSHGDRSYPSGQNRSTSPSASRSQSAAGCDRDGRGQPAQSPGQERNRMNHKRSFSQSDRDGRKSDSLILPPDAKKSKADKENCRRDEGGVKTDSRSGDNLDPLSLLIKDKDSVSGEDDESGEEDDAKPNMLRGQGLASLISSYGSDSSDQETDDKDTENKDEDKREKDGATSQPVAPSPQHSGPPAVETSHRDSDQRRDASKPQPTNKDHSKKQKQQKQRQAKPARKPTLLEMLLAKEIRHERNVIMQCVHYIVSKKFLGVCDGKP